MGGCSFAVSERHPTTNCRTPDLTGIKPLIKKIWKGTMFGWVFVRCVGTSPNYIRVKHAPNLVSILNH